MPARQMVDFKNNQDLRSHALQAHKSASCFVPHCGNKALDALILPNYVMQIQSNADHDPLPGQAIADALQVRI